MSHLSAVRVQPLTPPPEHLCREELFASPQRSSQTSSLGCNSLPGSQSEPSQQEASVAPREASTDPPAEVGRAPPARPEPPAPVRQKVTSSPSNKVGAEKVVRKPTGPRTHRVLHQQQLVKRSGAALPVPGWSRTPSFLLPPPPSSHSCVLSLRVNESLRPPEEPQAPPTAGTCAPSRKCGPPSPG